MKEKYTIQITDNGMNIICEDGKEIHLSATDALMFLDILKNEKKILNKWLKKQPQYR